MNTGVINTYTPNIRFINSFRNLVNKNIAEYYGITTPLSVLFNRYQNSCTITLLYEIPPVYIGIKVLPTDINRHIMGYGGIRFQMHIAISPPQHYPIQPSIWIIKELFSNIPSELDIVEHMKYLMAMQIEINNLVGNWSPAITVEKEILNFLVKLLPCFELLVKPSPA